MIKSLSVRILALSGPGCASATLDAMLTVEFFIKGIVIGLLMAVPVGPIGILCLRRALLYGRASGFMSGLGAATADTVYSSMAAFGLTAVSDALFKHSVWLRLIGGSFLVYLGVRTFLARPEAAMKTSVQHSNLRSDYSSTLLLTLSNPATIFSFLAVFAGFGVAHTGGSYGLATLVVLGVFLGSALWWFSLSGVAGLFRHHLGLSALRWVNTFSGVVIVGFGLLAFLSLLL